MEGKLRESTRTEADPQAYIDFEIEEAERERARHLYERLLERTSHVKVFISYALMEVSTLGGGEDEDGNEIEGEAGDEEMARGVFERGYKELRNRCEKEDVSDQLPGAPRRIGTS